MTKMKECPYCGKKGVYKSDDGKPPMKYFKSVNPYKCRYCKRRMKTPYK